MQGILTFIISVCVGYLFFLYLSHPQKQKNKLPKISIGNVDILPNFRVHTGNKTYWFHHWFLLSIVIAVPIVVREDFQFPMVVEGLLIGGILQGLRYPDRFKFRHPRLDKQIEDLRKDFKDFTDSIATGKIFEQTKKKKDSKLLKLEVI